MKERVKDLIIKLISVKGVFALLSSIGFFMGKLPSWVFILAWVLFIGSREISKAIKVIISAKKEILK